MIKIFVYGEKAGKENYAAALEECGAQGIFSLDLTQAKDCHGLLLPGGGDIEPSRYGQAPAGSEEPDLVRDAAELELTANFLSWERPILGICRGIQMLNVAMGGDLIQDIPTADAHRHDPETGDRVHVVRAEPDSFLSKLYGTSFAVNSSHHQAVGKVAPGLRLAATCEQDGVIEAVECSQKRLYGVQWHPERMAFALRREDTVDGRAIFELFLKQCGM